MFIVSPNTTQNTLFRLHTSLTHCHNSNLIYFFHVITTSYHVHYSLQVPPIWGIVEKPAGRLNLKNGAMPAAYKVLSEAESTFDRRLAAVAPGPEK